MFGAPGATLAALCQKLRIMALCREAYTLDNTVDDAVTQNYPVGNTQTACRFPAPFPLPPYGGKEVKTTTA